MPSIRRRLAENVNDSKNTRMDIAHAGVFGNWRADELGHISRYCKIAELIGHEAGRLGRPTHCLEIGCGQVWALRYIYKGLLCKKSDWVASYLGVDIDPAVLDDFWPTDTGEGQSDEEQEYGTAREARNLLSAPRHDIHDSAWFQIFNGQIRIQDLTVSPILPPAPSSDGLYDVAWTTEVIEHMKPEFVEPWVAQMAAALRPGALAFVSTPNHDGSREKLPKDHVYEWGFQELKTLLEKYFELVHVNGVFIQHPRFEKALRQRTTKLRDEGEVDEADLLETLFERLEERFDPNWQRVIFAAFFPEVANNCAWTLRKR